MRKLLTVLTCAALAAGCTSTSTPLSPAAAATRSWIFTKAALDAVTGNPAARQLLAGARIYEILQGTETPSTAVPVVPTVSFKSFKDLQRTIDKHKLRPDARAVIYDAEHWPQTPVDEQQSPVTFYDRAADVAHHHGLLFIATPAMDLVNVDRKSANPAQDFLSSDIDGATATNADVVDIQAQSLEQDTAAYRSFVTAAAQQIHATHPGATVIAGLSTNPHGRPVPPATLASDMTAVANDAAGFWMNIPDLGKCANCATPRPDVAVGALTDGHVANLFRSPGS